MLDQVSRDGNQHNCFVALHDTRQHLLSSLNVKNFDRQLTCIGPLRIYLAGNVCAIRHLFHVHRTVHSSSTTEGILCDRVPCTRGVASDNFVCRCCKCCKKCCKRCKCLAATFATFATFAQQSTTEHKRAQQSGKCHSRRAFYLHAARTLTNPPDTQIFRASQ